MPTIPKNKARPWNKNREPRIVQGGRKNPNNKFYTSKRWRDLREQKLNADPLCVECMRNGITRLANVVDHIVPINQGGEELAWDNIQSMCQSCHNKKSGRESRG